VVLYEATRCAIPEGNHPTFRHMHAASCKDFTSCQRFNLPQDSIRCKDLSHFLEAVFWRFRAKYRSLALATESSPSAPALPEEEAEEEEDDEEDEEDEDDEEDEEDEEEEEEEEGVAEAAEDLEPRAVCILATALALASASLISSNDFPASNLGFALRRRGSSSATHSYSIAHRFLIKGLEVNTVSLYTTHFGTTLLSEEEGWMCKKEEADTAAVEVASST